jgi:polysaccharide pyruvyl transferase WcaK-like protein
MRYPHVSIACIGPSSCRVREAYGIGHIDWEPLPVRDRFSRLLWWRLRRYSLARLAGLMLHVATEGRRWRLARRQMQGYDALIVPGTGILDDFGQGAYDLPYCLLRWCRAANSLGIPVNFLSIGAESVSSRTTTRILQRAAQLADYRSYRDPESKENARVLGIDVENDPIYPDLAFSLPLSNMPETTPATWPPQTVGVGVMGYYGWNAGPHAGEKIYQKYLDTVGGFIEWLIGAGYSVRLLIGDTKADRRPVDDLKERFAAHMKNGDATSLTAAPIETVDCLLSELARSDIVMATRFHNVLLALLMQRPVLSLGYSPKNDAIMRSAGLSNYCRQIIDVDTDELIEMFRELVATPSPAPPVLTSAMENCRTELKIQYDQVFGGLCRAPS